MNDSRNWCNRCPHASIAVAVAAVLAACGAAPDSTPDSSGTDAGPPPTARLTEGGAEERAEVRALESPPQQLFPWWEYRPTRSVCGEASCTRYAELRWRRSAGASGYELDRGLECSPGCASCTRSLPPARTEDAWYVWESSDTGDGRGCWRVRALDGAEQSPWSEWRSIRLSRVPDDINGDGYSDLVVHTRGPRDSEHDSVVEIWYGGPSGLTRERVARVDLSHPTYREYQAQIIGDIDGDGFDDIHVVNAAYGRPRFGLVWLGGSEGLRPEPLATLPSESILAGSRLEGVGDLDADGFDDAIPSRTSDSFVFWGAPDGYTVQTVEEDVPYSPYSAPAGVADLDGDGYLDLAKIEPGEARLLVAFGGPRDLAFRRGAVLEFLYAHSARLARVDDLDGNGFAELIMDDIGLPMVIIEGPFGAADFVRTAPYRGRGVGLDQFGGDVDGDGRPELAQRRHYALHGSASANRAETAVYDGDPAVEVPMVLSKSRVFDPEEGAHAMGTSMSRLLDFDGDGHADQVWFAQFGDDDFRLLLFPGGPRGLAWSPTELHAFPPGTVTEGYVSRPHGRGS